MQPVLFLSYQHRYLSNRIFIAIAENLKGYKKIYLDAELHAKEINYETSFEEDRVKLNAVIEEYIFIPPPVKKNENSPKTGHLFGSNRIINIYDRLSKIKRWKKELIDKIKTINPAAIIFISDVSASYKISKLAFGESIPFIFIQHGLIKQKHKKVPFKNRWKEDLFYRFALGIKLSYKSLLIANEDSSNYLLFWTKHWRRHLKNRKKIYYIGALIYDEVFNINFFSKTRKFKTQLGLDSEKTVITITLNKSRNTGKKVFKQFAEDYIFVIDRLPQIQFVLKVHPVEDFDFCKEIYKSDLMDNVFLVKEVEWNSLLHASDIFITHWSSTLFLSMAAAIPTVLYSPISPEDLKNRNLDNFQYIATNKVALLNQIKLFNTEEGKEMFNATKEKFIRDQMLSDDGNNAKRAANAILKIVDKKANLVNKNEETTQKGLAEITAN